MEDGRARELGIQPLARLVSYAVTGCLPEEMGIGPSQFGLIVSSYAISAGISGIATGFFLDYFDRKRALLGLFAGFGVGTLFCALAPGYHLLVMARALAGAFGAIEWSSHS